MQCCNGVVLSKSLHFLGVWHWELFYLRHSKSMAKPYWERWILSLSVTKPGDHYGIILRSSIAPEGPFILSSPLFAMLFDMSKYKTSACFLHTISQIYFRLNYCKSLILQRLIFLSLFSYTLWTNSTFKHLFWMDGIFGYLTSHEAYCLCVGNHSGHNLQTRGWGDMKMKGQPNRDSNPVSPSQETNHATNWANEAGLFSSCL